MNEIEKLYQERAALVAKAGALHKAATANGGTWTAENEQEFNRLHDDADAKLTAIEGLKNSASAAAARADRQARADESLRASRGRNVPATDPVRGAPRDARGRVSLGVQFRGRTLEIDARSMAAHRATEEYQEAYRGYLAGIEPSAGLQTDIGSDGGYLAPPQYVAELVAELDNTSWIRQLARVLPPTSAPKVTMPRRSARMNPFQWGSELSTPVADTGLKFGKHELTPHYMTGEIEVSNDLMMAGSMSVEVIVRDEMLFNSRELEEQAFMLGDGANKPLGLFVASDMGIPTARDVAGGLDFDHYVDVKYSLREPYLRSANLRWVFHRSAIRGLAKLKATTGEPIWMVSTRDGQPDRFLDVPVVLSEYAPNGVANNGVYASGDYSGIIGDFANYDILDGLDMGIKRHTDSYYDRRNMTGFIVRRKVDGAPRIAAAFARAKRT